MDGLHSIDSTVIRTLLNEVRVAIVTDVNRLLERHYESIVSLLAAKEPTPPTRNQPQNTAVMIGETAPDASCSTKQVPPSERSARLRHLRTDPSLMSSLSTQLADGVTEFNECAMCFNQEHSQDHLAYIDSSENASNVSGEGIQSVQCAHCCSSAPLTAAEAYHLLINTQSSPVDTEVEFHPVTAPTPSNDNLESATTSSLFSTTSSAVTVVEVHRDSGLSPNRNLASFSPDFHHHRSSSDRAKQRNENTRIAGRGSLQLFDGPPSRPASEANDTSNNDEFHIPGEVLRRAWILSSTQMRSPRFHVIFGTALAKSIFSIHELTEGNVRGVGFDAQLNAAKLLAIRRTVAKYCGWYRRQDSATEISAKLRDIDAAIDTLCNDAKRRGSRLNGDRSSSRSSTTRS